MSTLHGTELGNNITGSNGADYIEGYGGNDFIYGRGGDDFIGGGSGSDYIEGGGGFDTLYGDDNDDWLSGDTGNDYVNGGPGNDTVIGGIIANDPNYIEWDTLVGGSGADTFVLGVNGYDSYFNGGDGGHAVIQDFKWQEGDKIEVGTNINNYWLSTRNWLAPGSTDALDTLIYRGDNLIAVVLDTTDVIPAYDFVVG